MDNVIYGIGHCRGGACAKNVLEEHDAVSEMEVDPPKSVYRLKTAVVASVRKVALMNVAVKTRKISVCMD